MKRGQIYLVASIILVAIISGFIFLLSFHKKDNSSLVYDLKKQLEEESSRFFGYNLSNSDKTTKDFIKDFSIYAGKNIQIYYIIGSGTNIKIYTYTNENLEEISPINPPTNNIQFKIQGINYKCNLQQGENFSFIIIQKSNDEIYIAKSEFCKD